MQQMKTITNDKGRAFNVRLVLPGERYGRDDCLIYGNEDDEPALVEFYDATYATEDYDFGPRGQFVSRYYLTTLLEDATRLCVYGLDLDGGVAAWKISGANVRDALVWALINVPWQAFSEAFSRRISEAISEPISGPKYRLEMTIKIEDDPDPDPSYLEQPGFEERLAAYRSEDFHFVGLYVTYELSPIAGGRIISGRSGGCWGIESDSEGQHFWETAEEEITEVKDELLLLGATEEQFAAAMAEALGQHQNEWLD